MDDEELDEFTEYMAGGIEPALAMSLSSKDDDSEGSDSGSNKISIVGYGCLLIATVIGFVVAYVLFNSCR